MKKFIAIAAALATSAAFAGFAIASPNSSAAPASAAACKNNIVQTAAKAGQFTTLVALAKKAGLAGTLSTKTLTLLAPTDAAFAKVPKSTLDALGKDKALLKSVLLYHVIAGKAPASTVVTLSSAKTLNGKSVAIKVKSGKVYINSARVTTPDVMACNGVIHVVNKVLIPPTS
jgi:uncharacterized surface protein with fasciclin (FAS1) repeats